jgi:hypothetical protein
MELPQKIGDNTLLLKSIERCQQCQNEISLYDCYFKCYQCYRWICVYCSNIEQNQIDTICHLCMGIENEHPIP